MTRHTPEQKRDHAVWVKCDDEIGWRIVHESDDRDSCWRTASLHILKAYPVLNVEIRSLEPWPPTEIIYEFKGDMP